MLFDYFKLVKSFSLADCSVTFDHRTLLILLTAVFKWTTGYISHEDVIMIWKTRYNAARNFYYLLLLTLS